MNNNLAKILSRFLLLIPLQVLIANHMRLFGYINPQICILFVIWYPPKKDLTYLLISSFFLGMLLDVFSNSGGVNTAALLLISYIKLPVLKVVLNDKDMDLQVFRYRNYSTLPKITFVFSLAIIHQFTLYLLAYFNVSYIGDILFKSLTSSLFTTFVTVVLLSIFTPVKK